jgi:hypothetical protein
LKTKKEGDPVVNEIQYKLELAKLIYEKYCKYVEEHPNQTDKEKKTYYDGLYDGVDVTISFMLNLLESKLQK